MERNKTSMASALRMFMVNGGGRIWTTSHTNKYPIANCDKLNEEKGSKGPWDIEEGTICILRLEEWVGISQEKREEEDKVSKYWE